MRALRYVHGGRVPLSMHFHEGNIDTVAALLDANPDLSGATPSKSPANSELTRRHETSGSPESRIVSSRSRMMAFANPDGAA